MPKTSEPRSKMFSRSCKLGTMPALVRVHGRDKIEVGSRIRIQECWGDNWHTVRVTKVNPDGYFFADR
jgi:hypothetical protein